MQSDAPAGAAWPRTYLFVPGDRPERFDSAWASPADAVILDLEDAVPADRKTLARHAVAGWLSAETQVWIRVNAADTMWFVEDLGLLHHPGVAGVVVPKAEELPDSLLSLSTSRRLAVMPLIETAVGMHRAEQLAMTPGVTRLAFGSIDFQADLNIEGDDEGLLYFRSRLVLASRLGSLPPPVDGVTVAISETEQLQQDTLWSQRLGFGAKLCIHPRQIGVVHEVMSPSEQKRQWATRVIAAMKASEGAAVQVDGRMVDRPVLLRALQIASALPPDRRLR